ncbi:hypothetical protein BKA70DRAFT_1524793 [Coprinopsis sp. MPI-PUGE-AT-0042]|nr:hypothetical protein BKA70DRAFT_1524793 [Coprinopsis sp. MPI-PUGE-AT-0042]
MGKLNIAHHKSYHPYRRDNIERVKKDEEEARLKEEKEEGRMLLADAEARIQVLRERAEIDSSNDERWSGAQLPTTNGHINFFEDLESQNTMAAISQASAKHKAKPVAETEKGVALAPSEKDLRPWYSSSKPKGRKMHHWKSFQKIDAAFVKEVFSASLISAIIPSTVQQVPTLDATSRRPTSSASTSHQRVFQRQRALALIERKKGGSSCCSRINAFHILRPTPYGGNETPGYSDQFNKEEVQLAHRSKDYVERWRSGGGRERRWDEDEERGVRGGDDRRQDRRI